jgi:bifunctional non-homologous end joining protein LigD
MAEKPITLELDGREVQVTNPGKVFFPQAGYTKLDIVNYFLAVAEGALVGVRNRPMVLKRFVNGADEPPFFQKRAPANIPPGIETAHVTFPSGRSADLCVVDDVADLAWVINLGCLDLNPWHVRANDVDHPDEWRIDLDPTPEANFGHVKELAMHCKTLLDELGYRGYPKTSGSRGIHVNIRIEPKWTFTEVRRCALAFGRELERRVPELATTAWWKEERHGVFIDYNQNARDRTVASAYSVRPTPNAQVSCPLEWDELPSVELSDFTILTVPRRFAEKGDPGAGIDGEVFSLEPLLELMRKHEAEGVGDAPYPPHYPKAEGEPPRVQPSKRRMAKGAADGAEGSQAKRRRLAAEKKAQTPDATD